MRETECVCVCVCVCVRACVCAAASMLGHKTLHTPIGVGSAGQVSLGVCEQVVVREV